MLLSYLWESTKWGLLGYQAYLTQGIWVTNHLKTKQVKVHFSDVSAIQMFAIQISIVPTLNVVYGLRHWSLTAIKEREVAFTLLRPT